MMNVPYRATLGLSAIALALVLVNPLAAWQAELSSPPTKKDPLRFRAFNVSMQAGDRDRHRQTGQLPRCGR
jgi:hypothetical protein